MLLKINKIIIILYSVYSNENLALLCVLFILTKNRILSKWLITRCSLVYSFSHTVKSLCQNWQIYFSILLILNSLIYSKSFLALIFNFKININSLFNLCNSMLSIYLHVSWWWRQKCSDANSAWRCTSQCRYTRTHNNIANAAGQPNVAPTPTAVQYFSITRGPE